MPTNITVKNSNQRNALKVTPEISETDPKTKSVTWKPSPAVYVKAGEALDVWVAEGRRVIVQELPT